MVLTVIVLRVTIVRRCCHLVISNIRLSQAVVRRRPNRRCSVAGRMFVERTVKWPLSMTKEMLFILKFIVVSMLGWKMKLLLHLLETGTAN